MLWESVSSFFGNPLHLTVLIVSWTLALISFLYWHEHPKARYLYAHLFFLFLPLLDFAVVVPCQIPFVQGLLTFCSVVVTRAIIFAVPFAMLLAVMIGYHVAPAVYRKMYSAKQVSDVRFEKLARNAGLLGTRFFVLDTAKPIAFSIRKDVLMSVGMFELLNKKEQDAVLLHELGHVEQKSSLTKFSLWLTRLFSPIAHFASVDARINAEERSADEFAIRLQGTAQHLKAAKRKIAQL